jgi:hypothetical protein
MIMKKWIKLALASAMLAGLAALAASCGSTPKVATESVPQQQVAWRASCGQAMFSQISATGASFIADAASYASQGDASGFESDANQDTYLLGQWQTCADAATFDPALRAALSSEINDTATLWSEYDQGTPNSGVAAQASSAVTVASATVAERLCSDGAANTCA